ncbi:NBR1-Ig-like domain-containing protein [Actinomadura rugatobispora]|uniref:NBR1-Ig-like domain-containing protein n=1 Tax=Actinomadura rugatobispora TaxID=1994 RepID=A0ABW1AIQ9_9ACTN
MHEATKGNKLPSWGTTVEFVKACGADPAAYRERWENANRTVRSASAEGAATVAGTSAARSPGGFDASAAERPALHTAIGAQAPRSVGETSPAVPPPPPDGSAGDGRPPGGRGRSRLTRPAAVALVVAAVGVGTVVVVAVSRGSGQEGDGPKPSGGPSKAALSPADCPVRVFNPAPAPPAHQGDKAVFIADITLPDCTRVGAGTTVTKVWRLKNTGTVPWEGYSLRRLDLPQRADQCQTISDVPINDTRPGAMVDIRTDITTPRKPGLCYVRFKMVDAAGKVAFPGNRPVNFQVIVE